MVTVTREGETGGDAHSFPQNTECIVWFAPNKWMNGRNEWVRSERTLSERKMFYCCALCVERESERVGTSIVKKPVNQKVELNPSDHSLIFCSPLLCAAVFINSNINTCVSSWAMSRCDAPAFHLTWITGCMENSITSSMDCYADIYLFRITNCDNEIINFYL